MELTDGNRIEITFAYYRDLFDRPHAQGAGVQNLDEQEAIIMTDFMLEMVDLLLAESPDEQTMIALEHAHSQLSPAGQVQGIGDLVRRAVNAATILLNIGPLRSASQWASGKLMIRDLAQVARYLARGEPDHRGRNLDQRIRIRVAAELGDGPVIVVAHSLGTIVCLEAIHEYEGSVPLLVTLGSPLAMRMVVWPRLRPQPPRTPEVVERWLNFWDRDDIIVARPKLEAHVAPNTRLVLPESARVDSDGLWVHTATKYLTKPDVAGPIAEAIGRLAPSTPDDR